MDVRRVVITGMGAVTPIGLTVEEYWRNLVAGRLGITPITLFDTNSFPIKVAAEVKGFDPANYMSLKRVDRAGKCTRFGIAAARMALASACLDMSKEKPERVGVAIASTGMLSMIADQGLALAGRGPSRVDPLMFSRMGPSMVPVQVGLELGAKGPNTSVNSACASGNDAIGAALNFIRLGHADVMIAGGAEANVNPITLAMMARVGALSTETDPAKACRPFDLRRSGFVFGDGGGILLLETYEHAVRRDAPVLAELGGAGWSFDAYNEAAPDPTLEAVAMSASLRDAGVGPEHIDYINAHGTSTKLNDSSETSAIKIVFGDRAARIPVSSNKSMIGHLGCAAGAVEAIATVMTVNTGIIPPTIGYEIPDPECDLDYVPNQSRRQEVRVALSNSFGMGGQNCCIVIRRAS